MNYIAFKPNIKIAWRLALSLLLVVLCAACGSNVEPKISYEPPFLPVQLSIDRSGIAIEGHYSLVTSIGIFSIGARYALPPHVSGTIYVILRNSKTGYDHIFEVRSGVDQFMAVVNGTSTISITYDQVLIDISTGKIKKIAFKRVTSQITEQGQANWFQNTRHAAAAHWDKGWSQSWYKPFALSRWAYSDSTIEKWYGVGFVWFLLRLIFAVVLALIDVILTLGFLLGQVGFMIFGPTGRDVIYGLIILGIIFGIVAAVADNL